MGTVKTVRPRLLPRTTTPERATADHLDRRLSRMAARALGLAGRYRTGKRVIPSADLPPDQQGELHAAAIGSLGCSERVARICGDAIAEYEDAIREAADREAAGRVR